MNIVKHVLLDVKNPKLTFTGGKYIFLSKVFQKLTEFILVRLKTTTTVSNKDHKQGDTVVCYLKLGKTCF